MDGVVKRLIYDSIKANDPVSDLDDFVKSPNSGRANFVIMRRTCRTLNDYGMQHNAEIGFFTKPSKLIALKFSFNTHSSTAFDFNTILIHVKDYL